MYFWKSSAQIRTRHPSCRLNAAVMHLADDRTSQISLCDVYFYTPEWHCWLLFSVWSTISARTFPIELFSPLVLLILDLFHMTTPTSSLTTVSLLNCILFFKPVSSFPRFHQALILSLSATLALLSGVPGKCIQHILYFTSNSQKYWIEHKAERAVAKSHLSGSWTATLSLFSHQMCTHFGAVLPDSVPSACLSGCHLESGSPTKIEKANWCTQGLPCCLGRKLDRFGIIHAEEINFGCYSSPHLFYFSFQTVQVCVPVLSWELKL